jgi:hypothetical protein
MEDGPLYSSLCHTDVGFISDRFDWVADPKLFLVTVSDEIKNMRRTKKAKKFRRIVKNIFAPLKIDWDSGWDNTEKKGAVDYIAELIEPFNKSSRLFEDCDYYCLDLFQSLIVLPLEPQDYSNIRTAYETFLSEWVKIENEISNEFYNLYILKELVDAARNVRPEYLKNETRNFAVTEFRNKLYETLKKVSAFCVPKNVHFEKLLCSMYVFSKNIEGMLYEIITKRIKTKQHEYNKMLLKSTEQIFATINVNLRDNYVYNKNTKVLIIDNVLKINDIFELPEDELSNVNYINQLARGCYVYDLYKKTKINLEDS